MYELYVNCFYLRASGGAGIVNVSVCLSVCPYVCKFSHERIDGCRPNLIDMDRPGDDLEVVKFWFWCSSGSESRITFPLSLAMQDQAFYKNLNRISCSDQPIFTKLIFKSKRTHPIHFGIVSDRKLSGHLDPFPYPDCNPVSLWFCITDWLGVGIHGAMQVCVLHMNTV